ncbi:MAG: LPS-assembly protein LptD [Blastocatellia bacterium]
MSLLPTLVLLVLCCAVTLAQLPQQTERRVENPIGAAREQTRAIRKIQTRPGATAGPATPGEDDELRIQSDKQERQGNVDISTGNVVASGAGMRLTADRVTYNEITQDIIAEGKVDFEQDGQKLRGERLEFNLRTRRGSVYSATGITNRTPDGTTLYVTAIRADKTGLDSIFLEKARITACDEPTPKWCFTTSRARIRQDDRAQLYNPVLRIKNIPILYLPYLSISTSKEDRKSGFLLPSSGQSTIKGRTFTLGYFQTLGRSADLLVRTDVFTKRGIGLGFDFHARTDENSRIALGSFLVFDRVLGQKRDAGGNPLPDQGGSSFYVDAVQYFKNGFVAVADVNITSSFTFRQVFAENVLQALSPEERSLFYINRNWSAYSLNLSLNEQSNFIAQKGIFLRDQNGRVINDGNGNPIVYDRDTIVKSRQMPSFNLSRRSSPLSEKIPFYFSFDSSLEGVRRSETSGDQKLITAPSIVQRLDFAPRVTFPLKSFGNGFTLTPSVGFRSTFYSDSVEPSQTDPTRRQFVGRNLFRQYADVEVDFRTPSLARVFRHRDGSPWFRHLIEPYVAWRRIAGIDEYNRTPLIDERDAVASTNEIEYGIANRFFVRRPAADKKNTQAYEMLAVSLSQKYYFDPTFGGALRECGVGALPGCQRQQFLPINNITGFSYGGLQRNMSPLNMRARLRPSELTFADIRLDYDTRYNNIRNLVVGGGLQKSIFSFSHSWFFTRLIPADQFRLEDKQRFDPSTYPGNQLDLSTFVGSPTKGPYAGMTLAYDFRDKDIKGVARDRSLIYLISTAGWAWDCCGMQVQNVTFNAGFRKENRIVFAFTLKGIGTFGTEQIGQRRIWGN